MNTNMYLNEVNKLIVSGDFSSALNRIKSGFREKKNSDLAFSLVTHLYRACFDKNTNILPNSLNDLYELLNFLCQRISENWNCDHLKFMQCFYHLNCFILKHNPLLSRKLCRHLYSLKECKGTKPWNHGEFVVVSNLVHNFSVHLSSNFNEYLSSEGDNSFSSWLSFLCELLEFLALNKFYKIFVNLDIILFKVHNTCNDRLKSLIVFYCVKMRKWAEGLILKEKAVECAEKDVSALLMLMERMIFFLDDADILMNSDHIFEFIHQFNELWGTRPEIAIVMDCLKLCSRLDRNDEILDLFDAFSTHFQSLRPETISSAVPTIHRILYKFRIRISTCSLIDSRLPPLIRLMTVVLNSHMKNGDSSQKKSNLMETVFCALLFAKNQRIPKNSLESVYEDVKIMIKEFLKTDLDYRNSYFSVGVSAIVNLMVAYSRKELYSETNHIASYCLHLFLKVDPEFLSQDQYFKSYVETWLTTFSSSSVKAHYELRAQTMFIIMASVHPKFAGSAMKSWATVKKSIPAGTRTDETVVDVIKIGGEEMEKYYPKFKVINVDFEHLLFEEVHAYSKVRELCNGPVLAVYKAAAKTVKDCIALANILCCTVDSFSFDINDTIYLPYLEDSVQNVIARLQKFESEDGTTETLKSVILCTLGNLFYSKGRIILQRIRQKSEKETSEMEKLNLKGKIPVLRSGEKDDLDITEVTPTCYFYRLKNQTEILPVFNEALNYWTLASNGLSPHKLLTATLSFMKGTGYILRLYGFKEAELKCWTLLHNIARKLDSKKSQILAAAELLVVAPSVDSNILNNAENLLRVDDSSKRSRINYVHQLYRAHLAKSMLLQGKVEDCREIIKQVDFSSKIRFLVKAQFEILSALLNILDSGKEECSNEAPLNPIVHNFEGILYLVKNNQWDTFNEAAVVQLLMFELSTLLGVLYSDLKVIRSARCYVKVGLNLVQRLAFPSRICQLTSLRIWVDLLTWNVAECDLNAQELELMLDLGALKEDVQVSSETPGSPRLVSCSVKCVPHFLSSDDCDCDNCNDPHYPILVLNAVTLRILMSIGGEDYHLAAVVIRVGLSIVEKIKDKTSPYSMLWEPISCPVARFYYVVANYKFLRKNYQQAIHYSTAAIESLINEPVVNVALLCSLKRLQTAINSSMVYVRPKRDKPVSRRFGAEVDGNRPITPEHLKYDDVKPWASTVKPVHTVEKGYFSRGKSFVQKSLFDDNVSDKNVELEAITDTPPPSHKPKRREAPVSNLFATPKPKKETAGRKYFQKTVESGLTNVLGTPASLGLASKLEAKTPVIKVFYDPEGVECQSSKRTVKTDTIKRQVGALSKGKRHELKFETPRKPRGRRVDQMKLDDSDDEWQLSTPSSRKLNKIAGDKISKSKEATASSLCTPGPKKDIEHRKYFPKTVESSLESNGIVSLDSDDAMIELGTTPLVEEQTNKSDTSKMKLKLNFGSSKILGTPTGSGLVDNLETNIPTVKVYNPEGVECQSSTKTPKSNAKTAKRPVSTIPTAKIETPCKPRVGRRVNQIKSDNSNTQSIPSELKYIDVSNVPSIVVSSVNSEPSNLSAPKTVSESDGTNGISASDTDGSIVEVTPPRMLRKRPTAATPSLQLVKDLQQLSLSTKTPKRPPRSCK